LVSKPYHENKSLDVFLKKISTNHSTYNKNKRSITKYEYNSAFDVKIDQLGILSELY